MFEFALTDRPAAIPAYVNVEEAIPGYVGMGESGIKTAVLNRNG